MIKEILQKINRRWYISIIIMILGFVITFLGIQTPNEIIFNLSLLIFYGSFLFSLIFGIKRFLRKEYLKGFLQTLGTVIIGAVSFSYLSLILMFYPYDFFANNLSIPKNIKFEKPISQDTKLKTSIKPCFILYDDIQPGIYKYELYLNKIEKGKVYLKIYEITNNQILSEKDIEKRSLIEVYNPNSKLKKFGLNNDFMIYEGDWGQLYGSRIEIWFRSDLKNQPERKLMTKYYIIQGWQR